MIDSTMLPDFIIEAIEHLEELESNLLQLEEHQDDKEVLNEIFRSMHTIKGSAQFVGIERVSELSHTLENLMDLIRRDELQLSGQVFSVLIDGKDRLSLLVNELEDNEAEETEIDDLVARIKTIVDGGSLEEESVTEESLEAAVLDQEIFSETVADNGHIPHLQKDIMEEEHDEELYGIFVQQLMENIPFLHAQDTELASSVDKQDVLNRCSDSIKGLKSSANYMGYEKLTQHYADWLDAIADAVAQLSSGRMPNLHFMGSYIDEIVKAYPEAMEGEVFDNELEETDNSSREIEDTIESLFGDAEGGEPGGAGDDSDMIAALDSVFDDSDSPVSALEDEEPDEDTDEDTEEDTEETLMSTLSADLDEQLEEVAGSVAGVLVNEATDEEYDEELVGIFLRQLRGDIPYLDDNISELDGASNQADILKQCSIAVKRLVSSANYMGYTGLTDHYTRWEEEITGSLEKLAKEGGADLAFMRSRLDAIIKAYPESMDEKAVVEESGRESTEQGEAEQEAEFEDVSGTIGALLGDAVFSSERGTEKATATTEDKSVPEQEKKQSKAPVETKPDEPDVPEKNVQTKKEDKEEEGLFATLSKALDASLTQPGSEAIKPMHSVIEEMIESKGKDATTPVREEKKKEKGKKDPLKTAESKVLENKAPQAAPPVVDKKIKQPLQAEQETKEPAKAKPVEKKIRQSMRVDAEKIDFLMNQVGELVVSRAYFAQLFGEMRALQQDMQDSLGLSKSDLKPLSEFAFRLGEAGMGLGRVSNELQEGVMKVRMLPIAQLFKRYPRLVRDLSHKNDKQINLETRGEETELDKMVIEEISDPLVHIIRNAVDHGIETTTERKKLGKPEKGTLLLEAYHESDHIVIEVTDDGKGVDIDRVKEKALEKGLHTEEDLSRMSSIDLMHIIMMPGFSTTDKATTTSGRGVGMDVVKKNIEKLNGSVEIETKLGKGTRIRIKIPLTMAIIQSLMVRIGQEKFTIPLRVVEETMRISWDEISVIEGIDVIHLRDITMPIFRLSRVFGIERLAQDEGQFFVVVVRSGMQIVGLVVDELLGQEEVVIKPLADYLRQGSGFSGATILGDGGISLILDIPELMQMTTDKQIRMQQRLYENRVQMDAPVESMSTPVQ